ncbi:MAG: TonB-dependent receptor [Saprospiraceae bacterium]|nr:TonB-dependent receptor [Saprospiraceae bacterium]
MLSSLKQPCRHWYTHALSGPLVCTLLVLFSGRSSAQTLFPQQVSFTCLHCPPADALVQLSRQTGVNIVFNSRLFVACEPGDWAFENADFLEIVQRIAACSNAGIKTLDGQVVLFKKNIRHSLNGYVMDAATGERLLGATVRVMNQPDVGTVTNEFGFFTMSLLDGEHQLRFSYIGYLSDTVRVNLESDRFLRVRLRPNAVLPELVITDAADRAIPRPHIESPRELSLEKIDKMPSPGGEPDLLRFAALQSGVQTGVDGLGSLSVRGGNADQNLFLLDDVPVYSPSHALGLFSIYNPATINSAKLWKGDFPARYGGRTSSVIDVRTRDGNLQEYHAEVSGGLFASSGVVEGPIVRNRSSALLGFRFTYFDPWIQLLKGRENLLDFTGDKIAYRFYDANFKWNYAFSDRHRIYLSLYTGGDGFGNSYQQRYDSPFGLLTENSSINTRWGNKIAALRWNFIARPNLFVNTTVRYSRFLYRSSLQFRSEELFPTGKVRIISNFGQLYQTLIEDWSGKTDVTWSFRNRLNLRTGLSHTIHDFQPGVMSVNFLQPGIGPGAIDSLIEILLTNINLKAGETESYVDMELTPNRFWNIEAGVNASLFSLFKTRFMYALPRFRVQRSGRRGWNFWLGVHKNAQYLHQVGSYNVSLPFELWVPSTNRVPPEVAWQYSLGTGWTWKNGWNTQITAYDKQFSSILTFVSSNDALTSGGAEDATGWEDRISSGIARSRGLEFVLERTRGRAQGQLAYTLSKSERQFPDLNSGKAFPYRLDRRHDVKISYSQKISHWLDFNLIWSFATGNPITLAGVKYRHESAEGEVERDVFLYTEVNGYRLPDYHRLDAALNFNYKTGRIRHEAQIGVYNAYNRANPFYLFVDASSGIRGRAIQYTLLPVLPSLRYTLKW